MEDEVRQLKAQLLVKVIEYGDLRVDTETITRNFDPNDPATIIKGLEVATKGLTTMADIHELLAHYGDLRIKLAFPDAPDPEPEFTSLSEKEQEAYRQAEDMIGGGPPRDPYDHAFRGSPGQTVNAARRAEGQKAYVPDLPKSVVVDQNGNYWRNYGTHYSMPPVSTDNEPVMPYALFVLGPVSAPGPDVVADDLPLTRVVAGEMFKNWVGPTESAVHRIESSVAEQSRILREIVKEVEDIDPKNEAAAIIEQVATEIQLAQRGRSKDVVSLLREKATDLRAQTKIG